MRKILTVGLFAVGTMFAIGMLRADVRAEFAHSVSYQLDNVVEGLDRFSRVADRLGRAVDRIAARVFGRDDSEVAQTVRTRVSEAADRVRSTVEDERRVRDERREVRRQDAERFTWTGRVGTGQTVEIKGVNGSVSAQAADGNEVEVVAIKDGRRSDPGEVVVEVVEHGGGVTVCAVYPSRRSRENVCAPGSDGSMSVRNNDVEVEFRVRVPEHVRLVATTVNGDVDATGLGADVSATTVNGSIDIGTTGSARATTVNGSIEATLGAHGWEEALEFNTVNGSITVEVPEGLDADVDASWVSGGITSDVPLTVQGKFGARRARGTLGAGGPLMELKTVNGEIRLRESGS